MSDDRGQYRSQRGAPESAPGLSQWFDDRTPAYDDLKRLTERQRARGRRYAGFNPAREEEIRLFAAVLAGDHITQGFCNKDIRTALYADAPSRPERAVTAPPSAVF